jgi:hypothetical protein
MDVSAATFVSAANELAGQSMACKQSTNKYMLHVSSIYSYIPKASTSANRERLTLL